MTEDSEDPTPQHILAMLAGTVAIVMALIGVFDLTMYFYDTFSAPLETVILLAEAAVIFGLGVFAWKKGDEVMEAKKQ